MLRLLSAFLLAAPLLAYAVDQNATPAPAPHHKAHKKPTSFVLPPFPAGPLRQVPMDQLPAAPPKVTYQNGLLTIAAQNATLGEILRDVRTLTGASIDIPQGGGSERVIAQLGPGAPRDVLAQLLNGTSFNYVMVGSTSDPNAVATMMLSSKPTSGEVQSASNTPPSTFQPVPPMMPGGVPAPQPFRQQMIAQGVQPQPAVPAAAEADDNSDDSDNADDNKDDEGDQAQTVTLQPDGNAVVQQVDPNQPNAGPKSPEQILQMMRQGQPPNGLPTGPGPVNGPPPEQQ
jgi:hypothetical protein